MGDRRFPQHARGAAAAIAGRASPSPFGFFKNGLPRSALNAAFLKRTFRAPG
jgi:hypothetical protein